MGSKSSSAPAPDPRLIEAQIRSMGIQDESIQRLLANSEAMMPLQKEQMQFGLDTSRKAYDQSQDDRSWMLGKRNQLSGVQDTMLDEAKSFNTQDKQDELAGKAMADVNQGFASAKDQNTRAQQRMGVNPSSGRSMAMGNQMAIAQASALASAGTNARTGARLEGRAMTDRASNALSGYPAMGMAATGAGAGYGAAGLATANNGLAGMNSGFGAASTAAGQMGSNATNAFSSQAGYKNSQDQMANQGDPMLQMLGAGAMKFAMSDVNQKTKVGGLRPGAALAKVNAMPVSEWQYKDDSPAADGGVRHTGPMAQDVQRVAGEEAGPGGVAIDLVSLNGLNMAATQDVDDKLDKLTAIVSRLAIKGGLRQEMTHG